MIMSGNNNSEKTKYITDKEFYELPENLQTPFGMLHSPEGLAILLKEGILEKNGNVKFGKLLEYIEDHTGKNTGSWFSGM